MLLELLEIALLCVLMGVASIPLSFSINSSPIIVWFGNALGSLFSAVVVIYIIDHIGRRGRFSNRLNKSRVGKKVINKMEQGENDKSVKGASNFINKHGLKLFSLFCPLFPGVLISTVVVYLLNLNKKTYIHWMLAGVTFISGIYVLGYWWIFVK